MSTTTSKSNVIDPASAEFINTESTVDPASPVDIYAEAEEKVEAARKALRLARQEREEAEDVLPALRGRLMRGDSTVQAIDLAAAAMAEDRAELILKGCEARLKRLAAAGPHRPATAGIIAAAVAKGLDVELDNVLIVDDPNVVGDVLTVTLHQSAATTPAESLTGALACKQISATHWRSSKHRAADWVALEDALTRAGHFASVASRAWVEKGGLIGDKAVIEVRAAFPEVLELPASNPSNYQTGMFLGAVLSEAREHLPFHITTTTAATSATRTVHGSKVTTVVESTLVADAGRNSSGGPRPLEGAGAALAAAPKTLIDKPAGGLGHLEKVEVLPPAAGKDRFDGKANVRIRATFTGKVAK